MQYHRETILENIRRIRQRVRRAAISAGRDPESVRIVAATKTVPADVINFICENGICLIGENRAQELLAKYDRLDRRVTIHFIGALQTNKVKYVIDKVEMIHSVDSERLAAEISRQARKHGKVMPVLIEVNIAGEQSKSGVSPDQVLPLLEKLAPLPGISVKGLMAIPPAPDFTGKSDLSRIKNGLSGNNMNPKGDYDKTFEYFQKIQQILIDISAKKIDNISIEELSLGMSGDFEEAIMAGSTMIRPGRILFGERH